MKDVSMTMNSRLCNKTPLRDCDAKEGKIVCQTVYESGKYIIIHNQAYTLWQNCIFCSKNDRKITLENITNNCKQTAESGSKRKQTAEFGFKNVNKQLNLV